MKKFAYQVFPAIGFKDATDSILYSVANFVAAKFPQNAIRQVFVNTAGNMRSIYKNAVRAYNGDTNMTPNDGEVTVTPRPHMFVGWQFSDSFLTEDTGLGMTMPYIYPSAYYLQNSMRQAFPELIDNNREITIATHNIRIKVTAEFCITCKSRDEQLTLYNFLRNEIKEYLTIPIIGGKKTGIKASYFVPMGVIQYIKNVLYGPETSLSEIGTDLDMWLQKYSKGGIVPVYRNNDPNDKFYELRRIYSRVDFMLTGQFQIDEGSKVDDVADNFTIRWPAVTEFYIPTNYVIKTPELVIGAKGINEVSDWLALDSTPNADQNYLVKKIPKAYEDTSEFEPPPPEGMILLGRSEFALEAPEDYYDLHFLLNEDTEIGDMTRFLTDYLLLTDEERKKYTEVRIYRGRYLLTGDKIEHSADDPAVFYIHQGKLDCKYRIEMYYDVKTISEILKNRRRITNGKQHKH